MAQVNDVSSTDYSNLVQKDGSSSNDGTLNNKLDKDAFLRLLTTQLSNQDPLNPMEDKDFIAQMAQFSSLEQLQNMNETMQLNTVLLSHANDSILEQSEYIEDLNDNIKDFQEEALDNNTEIINQLINLNKALESYDLEE